VDENSCGGEADKTSQSPNNNQPLCWRWTAVRDSMGEPAEDDNDSGSGSGIR